MSKSSLAAKKPATEPRSAPERNSGHSFTGMFTHMLMANPFNPWRLFGRRTVAPSQRGKTPVLVAPVKARPPKVKTKSPKAKAKTKKIARPGKTAVAGKQKNTAKAQKASPKARKTAKAGPARKAAKI
jgi:hypothetical protein